ncbi:MAG TPA: SAM-dependent methyltransferase [Pseudonocardia sp.]|nr:SAM-dependent methyltransferase [Pseudonocardia sp.]
MSVEQGPPGVDTSRPHPARRYDYWLDGKDNYAADRASAEEIEQNAFPTVRLSARENRQFLGRAVSYLAEREGIRQFLDIGAGLPAANNVHEVAQAVDPRSRVVYVDNDPIVLAHARVLLQGTREGATAYIDADVRRPSSILTDPDLLATLDMTQPVALTLLAIMHFISDAERPYEIVAELRDALPPGSFVVITHATSDHLSPDRREASARANKRAGVQFQLRTSEEFAPFFAGLDLVPPGITSVVRWRPPIEQSDSVVKKVSMLCGVGRVP